MDVRLGTLQLGQIRRGSTHFGPQPNPATPPRTVTHTLATSWDGRTDSLAEHRKEVRIGRTTDPPRTCADVIGIVSMFMGVLSLWLYVVAPRDPVGLRIGHALTRSRDVTSASYVAAVNRCRLLDCQADVSFQHLQGKPYSQLGEPLPDGCPRGPSRQRPRADTFGLLPGRNSSNTPHDTAMHASRVEATPKLGHRYAVRPPGAHSAERNGRWGRERVATQDRLALSSIVRRHVFRWYSFTGRDGPPSSTRPLMSRTARGRPRRTPHPGRSGVLGRHQPVRSEAFSQSVGRRRRPGRAALVSMSLRHARWRN